MKDSDEGEAMIESGKNAQVYLRVTTSMKLLLVTAVSVVHVL